MLTSKVPRASRDSCFSQTQCSEGWTWDGRPGLESCLMYFQAVDSGKFLDFSVLYFTEGLVIAPSSISVLDK